MEIDIKIGTKLSGHVLTEKIGQGGMGDVYKAWDEKLSRYVAIKVMRPPQEDKKDDQWIKRFLSEARVLAQIKHEWTSPREVDTFLGSFNS